MSISAESRAAVCRVESQTRKTQLDAVRIATRRDAEEEETKRERERETGGIVGNAPLAGWLGSSAGFAVAAEEEYRRAHGRSKPLYQPGNYTSFRAISSASKGAARPRVSVCAETRVGRARLPSCSRILSFRPGSVLIAIRVFFDA